MKLLIVVSLARLALHMICDTLSLLRTEEICDISLSSIVNFFSINER